MYVRFRSVHGVTHDWHVSDVPSHITSMLSFRLMTRHAASLHFKQYRVASVATLYLLFIHLRLEFGVAGGAGEGDYVADVGHTGDE